MKTFLYISKTAYKVELYRDFVSTLDEALGETSQIIHSQDAVLKESDYILHIFGNLGAAGCRLIRWVRKKHIPTIYSPLGQLLPWNLPAQSQPLYRKAISSVCAIHTWSKAETNDLLCKGWNSRIQMIPNALVSNTITKGDMIENMKHLYQKVVDTYVAEILNEDTRKLLYSLLQAGLDNRKVIDKQFCNDTKELAKARSIEEWRTLFLYANDEYILEDVNRGLERLHIDTPSIDVNAIQRFPPLSNYPKNSLQAESMEQPEETISQTIKTIKNEERHRNVPLSHYADLFSMLRYTDYDEQKLTTLLKKQRMDSYTKTLMDKLGLITGLTEGYIPYDANN